MKKLLLTPLLLLSFAQAQTIQPETVDIEHKGPIIIDLNEPESDTEISRAETAEEIDELLKANQEKLAEIFDFWHDNAANKLQKKSIRLAQKMLDKNILNRCTKDSSEKGMVTSTSCSAVEMSLALGVIGKSVLEDPTDFIELIFALAARGIKAAQ